MSTFKIRDRATGLYSTGGSTPRWSKRGKVWTNIGHVKQHLQQLWRDESYPETAEIVEFVEVEGPKTSVHDLLRTIAQQRNAAEQERQTAREARARTLELAELARLQAKYPGVL